MATGKKFSFFLIVAVACPLATALVNKLPAGSFKNVEQKKNKK